MVSGMDMVDYWKLANHIESEPETQQPMLQDLDMSSVTYSYNDCRL